MLTSSFKARLLVSRPAAFPVLVNPAQVNLLAHLRVALFRPAVQAADFLLAGQAAVFRPEGQAERPAVVRLDRVLRALPVRQASWVPAASFRVVPAAAALLGKVSPVKVFPVPAFRAFLAKVKATASKIAPRIS